MPSPRDIGLVIEAVRGLTASDADLSRVEMRTINGKTSVLLQSTTPRKLFGRNYETAKAIRLAIAEALGVNPDSVQLQIGNLPNE
jgi:ribosomal protein S3